jgi:hypothetical protein
MTTPAATTTAPMNATKIPPAMATAPARRDPRPFRLRRRLDWRRRLTVVKRSSRGGPVTPQRPEARGG